MPDSRDPVAEGWVPGEPVGLLGIELHTRRRNRLNGTLVRKDNGAVGVTVGQSYGNCPQYIHARHLELVRDPAPAWQGDIESGQDPDGEWEERGVGTEGVRLCRSRWVP